MSWGSKMPIWTDIGLWIGAMNLMVFCAVILAIGRRSGDG